MFGDIRLETARLLREAGVITDEEFQAAQVEAMRQERERQERWRLQTLESRERFRALPWWKRFWRSESEWMARRR